MGAPNRGARPRRVRLERILQYANSGADASVESLSRRFGVTASTIRRDLADLGAQGKLTRTFGGAIAAPDAGESTLGQRLGQAALEKQAIARLAASRIAPGDTVYLDGGSTVGALAREIAGLDGVTVVTGSLLALHALADSPGITVHCIGGTLRSVSSSFLGTIAESATRRFSFTSAFLGADGVDPVDGICEADLAQTALKELVVSRAASTIVLVHAAKVGTRPFNAWANLGPHWDLITDDSVEDDTVQPFVRSGVGVSIASVVGSDDDAW